MVTQKPKEPVVKPAYIWHTPEQLKHMLTCVLACFFLAQDSVYQSRKEKQNEKHNRECIEFLKEDLLKLSELHPPLFMPNGNIGTSLKTFMNLIRTCQLPPHVIKKLGLTFPSGRSKHLYGNVCFDYDKNDKGNISLCAELKDHFDKKEEYLVDSCEGHLMERLVEQADDN